MMLDVVLEEPRWSALDLEALAGRAVRATLVRLELPSEAVEISLLACDDARMAVLNAEFRDKATPTNVLSWPSEDLAPEMPGGLPSRPQPGPDGSLALGDIAISWETCAGEAEAAGRQIADHVTHLIVHGLLHLLGYDHTTDADAARMEALEVEILGTFGLDDPYRDMDGV